MFKLPHLRLVLAVIATAAVAACGGIGGAEPTGQTQYSGKPRPGPDERQPGESTIWDMFRSSDAEVSGNVNRYLWHASLDVLDFLPVQSVDPFTGVISFGYGTPPGGGRAYRATVYITDPALAARSLNVALQTSGGQPVAAGTQRAVEDAILTRARQLRVGAAQF